jgi:hypothetical protein
MKEGSSRLVLSSHNKAKSHESSRSSSKSSSPKSSRSVSSQGGTKRKNRESDCGAIQASAISSMERSNSHRRVKKKEGKKTMNAFQQDVDFRF